MPKFKFAKLVRDKIVDHQIASGAQPVYRQLNEEEHKQALIRKISEESAEIAKATEAEIAAEIADVQQALDDLKEKYGLSDQDIAEAQAIKNAKNGAFKKGLYVESVEVADNNRWAAYYRQNPDQYPQID